MGAFSSSDGRVGNGFRSVGVCWSRVDSTKAKITCTTRWNKVLAEFLLTCRLKMVHKSASKSAIAFSLLVFLTFESSRFRAERAILFKGHSQHQLDRYQGQKRSTHFRVETFVHFILLPIATTGESLPGTEMALFKCLDEILTN